MRKKQEKALRVNFYQNAAGSGHTYVKIVVLKVSEKPYFLIENTA